MNKEIESKLGSTIYARINAVKMTESERLQALHALHNADLLVHAFTWVATKIEQAGSRLFLKPALKA